MMFYILLFLLAEWSLFKNVKAYLDASETQSGSAKHRNIQVMLEAVFSCMVMAVCLWNFVEWIVCFTV